MPPKAFLQNYFPVGTLALFFLKESIPFKISAGGQYWYTKNMALFFKQTHLVSDIFPLYITYPILQFSVASLNTN